MAGSNAKSPGTVALLLVQIVLGYEWLVSGLTKVLRGGFPQGLAPELRDMSNGAPGWYRHFLSGLVLPHAQAFGYVIEIAELAVGILLLVAVLRLPVRIARFMPTTTVAALLGGLVLAVNFALANGSSFGLGLATDSFDEGIDLDTLLVGIQLALLVYAVAGVRRVRAQEPISNSRRTSFSDIRLWDSSRQPTISGVGKP